MAKQAVGSSWANGQLSPWSRPKRQCHQNASCKIICPSAWGIVICAERRYIPFRVRPRFPARPLACRALSLRNGHGDLRLLFACFLTDSRSELGTSQDQSRWA
jgi:hypothetical protein